MNKHTAIAFIILTIIAIVTNLTILHIFNSVLNNVQIEIYNN